MTVAAKSLAQKLNTIAGLYAVDAIDRHNLVDSHILLWSAAMAMTSAHNAVTEAATAIILRHVSDISDTFEDLEKVSAMLSEGVDMPVENQAAVLETMRPNSIPGNLLLQTHLIPGMSAEHRKANSERMTAAALVITNAVKAIDGFMKNATNETEKSSNALFDIADDLWKEKMAVISAEVNA